MPEPLAELSIAAEPLDAHRCKFIVNRPVVQSGMVLKYTSVGEAAESPVAQAVLEVPGVCEVVVSSNVVTAIKHDEASWDDLEPQVRYAIETAVAAAAAPPAAAAPAAADMDDNAVYDLVAEIFERQINPAVAQHGGKVELLDVQEGTVVLRMLGGCQGCGMANVTLRQGIEGALRRSVPGFAGLKDITDHAAGTNPYFSASTK